LDPTISFQRCSACGGVPVLRVRRYNCRDCGIVIQSIFLFDGLIFDGEYFRQKMIESRQRRKEQRERVREMLAESRSGDLSLEYADLGGNLRKDLIWRLIAVIFLAHAGVADVLQDGQEIMVMRHEADGACGKDQQGEV